MAYNPDDPTSLVQGEVPYAAPRQSILDRIRKKLGPANIAGIIGSLTTPEGPIDPTGQRQGLSPFQAGLMGFSQGRQGYEALTRQTAAAAAQADLERRKVEAQESQASSAATRAGAYYDWAHRAQRGSLTMTPEERAQSRLKFYMGLDEHGRADARASGAIPYPPGTNRPERLQDLQVKSLMSQWPTLSEDEAFLLTNAKPTLLGTTQRYDITGKNVLEQSSNRNFGIPLNVRRILAKHGIPESEYLGITRNLDKPVSGSGPVSKGQVDALSNDNDAIDVLEEWLNTEGLTPEQNAWIENKLKLIQSIPDEPGEGDEEGQ